MVMVLGSSDFSVVKYMRLWGGYILGSDFSVVEDMRLWNGYGSWLF